MTKDMLRRLSAAAATLGGCMRVIDAFLDKANVHVQLVAYFATDTMLTFGLCGIYLSCSNRLGLEGLLGFAASITGLLMVRTFGPAAYLIGASVTLLGVVVLGVGMLVREAFPKIGARIVDCFLDGQPGQLVSSRDQLGRYGCWRDIRPGFIAAGIDLWIARRPTVN